MALTAPTKYISEYTKGLDIPHHVVDGNDVSAVFAATQEAVEWARAGKGPSMIEGITYRWYDHSGFAGGRVGQDGAKGLPYRTDDEVQAVDVARSDSALQEVAAGERAPPSRPSSRRSTPTPRRPSTRRSSSPARAPIPIRLRACSTPMPTGRGRGHPVLQP